MSSKQNQKSDNKGKTTTADESTKPLHGEEIDILEDDEFEEFETEDWPEKTSDEEEQQDWEEDWEDDELRDDEFARELRAELNRQKMSDE